ncbi:uncharacterized protein LOC121374422 [Gigantopelta aegis]|uniref:uncharacterized protein LOC121374422 n=1 Tax=Gigantopelta aegis TaxID=1735272 RepID=UPI001B888187|nr:uncharacterized protein LOC121374422 [Gigantopelta aegis]
MADPSSCSNCGHSFSAKRGSKDYGRRSFGCKVPSSSMDMTIKDVIEDEFNVHLTPEDPETRYLCRACLWDVQPLAKARDIGLKAQEKIKQSGIPASYLSKKLRSPVPTPRQHKKQKICTPQKHDNDEFMACSLPASPLQSSPPCIDSSDPSGIGGSDTPVNNHYKGAVAYSLCFDNGNQKVTTRHQTRDRNNTMYNMVQGYAALDRVPTLHLSDDKPLPQDILNIPLSSYLPTDMDEVDLRAEMTTMVIRVLCENLHIFQHLRKEITGHIKHNYSKESSQKSILIPVGVLDKDESKVADTIDILEHYHQYVPVKPSGDPLTIPLHADGLSCERGNDAQSARINGSTVWNQLQGLMMNIQEWHKRCLLLQDAYDVLYKGSSARDKGTLFNLKNYFNQHNVSGNVKDSFNFSEEFLNFCCDGYIVLAAMFFMDIPDINSVSSQYPTALQDQIRYVNSIATEIIDLIFISSQSTVQAILGNTASDLHQPYPYCVCKRDMPEEVMVYCENRHCNRGIWFHTFCMGMDEQDIPDGKWYCSNVCADEAQEKRHYEHKKTATSNLQDNTKHYTILVMWYGLNQKVRRDAIRENDGPRMLLHWKFDLLQFQERHHPKYFIVCHRLLTAVKCGVYPRLQATLTWNRTVNPRGGPGNSIAMDLQMEFFNKEYKESVKEAAGHITPATIGRHSQMVGVGKILREVYEKQIAGMCRSTIHKKELFSKQDEISE